MMHGPIGLVWYEREDYARARVVMDDPHELPPRYEGFLQAFAEAEGEAKGAGLFVVRVTVKPEEFSGWCRSRKLKADATARMLFAADVAAAEFQKR